MTNANIRLLMLVPMLPPYTGGGPDLYSLLLTEFSERSQIQVAVVVTEYCSKFRAIYRQGKCLYLRVLPPRDGPGWRGFVYHILSFVATYAILAVLVPLLVLRFRLNCIHYTRYTPAFPTPLDAVLGGVRRLGVLVILDLRGRISDARRVRGTRSFDLLLWNCQGTRQSALEAGVPESQGELIYSPFIAPARFSIAEMEAGLDRLGLSAMMPYLCFVGHVSERKGIFELLDAIRLIRREDDDANHLKLVIVGRNGESMHFRDRVRELSGVTYLGELPRDDALLVIQGAELLVLPSRQEGIPRVCMEAMSLGTPVITPPGIPEFEELPGNVSFPAVEAGAIRSTILHALTARPVPGYPTERHNPNVVATQTIAAYQGWLLRKG